MRGYKPDKEGNCHPGENDQPYALSIQRSQCGPVSLGVGDGSKAQNRIVQPQARNRRTNADDGQSQKVDSGTGGTQKPGQHDAEQEKQPGTCGLGGKGGCHAECAAVN